VTTDNYLPIR